ncbi:hypothetical protein [Clostridium scatologenes]|uniref:Uncharacterized protein n=1 Tax=Clostridium scatologenes TaxID=1548 RepID=A0A0E3K1M0_CLOSL|nr:hypothetical protein [Clostridium scatologenes]AKA70155.1 hypothetical protein CSCA_3030 [Clostridium scatologenes]
MDKKQVLKEEIRNMLLVIQALKEDIERYKILDESPYLIKCNEEVIETCINKIGKYTVMLNEEEMKL